MNRFKSELKISKYLIESKYSGPEKSSFENTRSEPDPNTCIPIRRPNQNTFVLKTHHKITKVTSKHENVGSSYRKEEEEYMWSTVSTRGPQSVHGVTY